MTPENFPPAQNSRKQRSPPKGPFVGPDFRVKGAALIRMHTEEFIKVGGQGQKFELQ